MVGEGSALRATRDIGELTGSSTFLRLWLSFPRIRAHGPQQAPARGEGRSGAQVLVLLGLDEEFLLRNYSWQKHSLQRQLCQ